MRSQTKKLTVYLNFF